MVVIPDLSGGGRSGHVVRKRAWGHRQGPPPARGAAHIVLMRGLRPGSPDRTGPHRPHAQFRPRGTRAGQVHRGACGRSSSRPRKRQQPQQVWGPLWLSAFSANGPRTHVPPFPGRRELRDFLGSALLGGEGGARSCVRSSALHRPSLSATRCVRRLASVRVSPRAGGAETAGMSTRARTDVL